MDFIAEFGFDVKKGQSRDLQRWLSENESKVAAACPSGIEYVGTYAVIYSSEKHSGAYRQLFRMESYGSQDTFAAAMKEAGLSRTCSRRCRSSSIKTGKRIGATASTRR